MFTGRFVATYAHRRKNPGVRPDSTAKEPQMGTITTNDGVEIFYKDWGSGQPIVISHGCPLSSDDTGAQMMFFLQHG